LGTLYISGTTEATQLNLVCKLTTTSNIQNAKLRDKRGAAYNVTRPTFKVWYSFYMSGMAEATNFTFGVQINYNK